MKRAGGILMPISALPGKYGIGSLGKEAYAFADFLKKSGQTYWQILPLGHTGYGDSPYQCVSAYAGNPYFIDLELLAEEGLLEPEELSSAQQVNTGCIDFNQLYQTRYTLLRKAFARGKDKEQEPIAAFRKAQEQWLETYSLYMSLKVSQGYQSWRVWEKPLQQGVPKVLKEKQIELEEENTFWVFVQYEFYKQWQHLKEYVNQLGLKIIGDLPFYVAEDSSDVWAYPENFQLDEKKQPRYVAGCPPDTFAKEGQFWGNPLYDWEYLKHTNYQWWMERMRFSLELYDVVRIDHFRGFESYWSIPYGSATAKEGQWIKGPGIDFFNALKKTFGEINVIVEDLGFLSPEIIRLKEAVGYPGMSVLQFAFDQDASNRYLPHHGIKNEVIYTGTHDNPTIKEWFKTVDEKVSEHVKNYLKLNEQEEYHWGFIRGAWSSVSDLAITQMQDLLGLGESARMNRPGTLGGNWKWRMKEGVLTDELAQRIYSMTKLYGRNLS